MPRILHGYAVNSIGGFDCGISKYNNSWGKFMPAAAYSAQQLQQLDLISTGLIPGGLVHLRSAKSERANAV